MIRKRHGALNQKKAAEVLEAILDGIEEGLSQEEVVTLPGLGSFRVTQRTKRKLARFSPSPSLVSRLNRRQDD